MKWQSWDLCTGLYRTPPLGSHGGLACCPHSPGCHSHLPPWAGGPVVENFPQAFGSERTRGLPCLCSMPRTHQIQSCQAERSGQRGQNELSPWCLAPGPPARLWVRNFLLQGSRWRSAGVSARNQHAVPSHLLPTTAPQGAPPPYLWPHCSIR